MKRLSADRRTALDLPRESDTSCLSFVSLKDLDPTCLRGSAMRAPRDRSCWALWFEMDRPIQFCLHSFSGTRLCHGSCDDEQSRLPTTNNTSEFLPALPSCDPPPPPVGSVGTKRGPYYSPVSLGKIQSCEFWHPANFLFFHRRRPGMGPPPLSGERIKRFHHVKVPPPVLRRLEILPSPSEKPVGSKVWFPVFEVNAGKACAA